ncbi:MAG TPA: photosynthetic reaction center cytochrome c subunit family protein [Blastocatellia bacterium]|nr:photosynthetic reaction center cytochrome c subunit family protein [Blastocatellia bacterium]
MPRTQEIIWSAATRRRFGFGRKALAISSKSGRSTVLSIGLLIGACVTASTPARNQTIDNQEKPAEQSYKNIQVLTGLPASELDGVMLFMSAALGVGCTHCHTNPWDSDEKSTKLATRKMIVMTRAINKENFSGNPAVTCYTCHRGRHNTEPLPPADLATTPAFDGNATSKPPALPSTDEVIARYVRVIGAEAAIENLKTQVSRGTETTTNRMTPPQTLPIEIVQAAPDKLLIARNNPPGVTLEGFDGSKGWTKDARGLREMTGKELTEIKREANFFRYSKIRETYPQMRVLSKEKVRDREAYVVGATSREDSREKLYFDVETGLLVRRFVAYKTALGSIPEVTDFDDYREVSGVKLPFVITWSRPPFGYVRKFTEIRLNSLVDTARFASQPK